MKGKIWLTKSANNFSCWWNHEELDTNQPAWPASGKYEKFGPEAGIEKSGLSFITLWVSLGGSVFFFLNIKSFFKEPKASLDPMLTAFQILSSYLYNHLYGIFKVHNKSTYIINILKVINPILNNLLYYLLW